MEKNLSFIIPVYNETESVEILYQQVSAQVAQLNMTYEIIFIDDGSTDSSVEVIKKICAEDNNIHLIVFRKNFGKAAALQAGFKNAAGSIVITMDADLQDEPGEIPKLIDKLNEGYDLVSGWKYNRLDPIEKRLPSKLFNKVTSLMSGIKLHDFNCGFKAYRKEVVENIDIYGEMHRYIPVLAYRKGYRIAEIPVQHNARQYGKSKYGFERYLRGFFDSLTVSFLAKYNNKPMHFFGKLGMGFSLIGFLICFSLTVQWFMGASVGDRPLLLLGILMILIGVQLICTGLLGDMVVDTSFRNNYNENHIKEKI